MVLLEKRSQKRVNKGNERRYVSNVVLFCFIIHKEFFVIPVFILQINRSILVQSV